MDHLWIIEDRLGRLVHESAAADPTERARHQRFIGTRLLTGALVLAALPVYLVGRGIPPFAEAVALACLAAPLVAALVLSRTGRLTLAHGISSAALVALIVCIAASSGGVASAATVWLVAAPCEALLSGSRRAVVQATLFAGLGALAIAGLDAGGLLSAANSWPVAVAMPVFALTAIAHAGALVLAHTRSESAQRAALRLRDARDRSLLAAIDDLVTWHDRNGHVLKASPAAMKLVGVAPGELAGRGLFGRVHVQDRPAFLKAISDAAVSDRSVRAEFRLHVGDDGAGERVVWAEMRAHRVEDGEPGSFAVVAVTRDISEHKRHEGDLEHARERAERADELKGRFLATVSHELRTPLNAIIGFSEILASDGMTYLDRAQRQDYARIIHESGHHLLEVVNTLLDMSRIETGNFDLSPEPFDAAVLVGGCLDLMRLKAEGAGVQLAREIAPDLPELVADRRACKQILINLISNAVKFTPRGGRVAVGVRRDRDRILFSVADTGCGVAEADLPKLGDPFFQVNADYDRPHEGTGLGLSVVRGLIGLHHGTLAIESTIGEGTTVTVSLPVDCRTGGRPPAVVPINILARPRVRAADQEMKQRA